MPFGHATRTTYPTRDASGEQSNNLGQRPRYANNQLTFNLQPTNLQPSTN
ncbi:MAG: hypothetical protein F6K56_03160 [Moorea sp. SIO3G5]|nr:hypothetical protein [Moorena sp. SIO3G5]